VPPNTDRHSPRFGLNGNASTDQAQGSQANKAGLRLLERPRYTRVEVGWRPCQSLPRQSWRNGPDYTNRDFVIDIGTQQVDTDWNDTLQQIRDLLDRKPFRTAISAEIVRLKEVRPTCYSDIAQSGYEFLSPEAIEVNRLLSLRNRVRTPNSGLAQVITREIIEKLPQPSVIVVQDVLDSAAEHLVVSDGNAMETNYEQFVFSVFSHLIPIRTPYTGGVRTTAQERLYIGSNPGAFTPNTSIAELPSGLYISCNAFVDVDDELLVSVCGFCSARALERASSQCFEVMRSVVPRLFRQEIANAPLADGTSDVYDTSAVGPIVRARLQQCLSMYFGAESKKMTFQGRRVRNAVQLLVESDRQAHNAIGLALSFAAIESLLGEKTQGIGEDIAVKTATLLFPDAEHRRGAINTVKKMYDIRSRSLHGEHLTVEAKTRERVRTLAGTVLRAVLDWLEFSARFGDTEAEASEFFADLQNATDTGKRFVGPSDNLGMSLAEEWSKE
jgi:hypothetical protein